MINISEYITNAQIATGLLLIVFLLLAIAFRQDSHRKHR